jgi:hypothetical protein
MGPVIALMKRVKGATLAEIMSVTKWQAHTVRGFISILGTKGGEKIESSKTPRANERTRLRSSLRHAPLQTLPPVSRRGRHFCLCTPRYPPKHADPKCLGGLGC